MFTLQWVTGMGGICVLVLLTQSQEHFCLNTFAFWHSLADPRLVSVSGAGVWHPHASPRLLLGCCFALSKAVTGEWPALPVLWFHPFPECLKATGLCICFPSSQCCQHSEILTGATVTITDTVCSAGCQSLFDHQNTNYTWLFSSRM